METTARAAVAAADFVPGLAATAVVVMAVVVGPEGRVNEKTLGRRLIKKSSTMVVQTRSMHASDLKQRSGTGGMLMRVKAWLRSNVLLLSNGRCLLRWQATEVI